MIYDNFLVEHPVRCKMGEWEGGIAYLNGGLVSGIEISKWSKIYRVLENKSHTAGLLQIKVESWQN